MLIHMTLSMWEINKLKLIGFAQGNAAMLFAQWVNSEDGHGGIFVGDERLTQLVRHRPVLLPLDVPQDARPGQPLLPAVGLVLVRRGCELLPQHAQSRELARAFLSNHTFLQVGRVGSTTENITQDIRWVEDNDKRDMLNQVLGAAGEFQGVA